MLKADSVVRAFIDFEKSTVIFRSTGTFCSPPSTKAGSDASTTGGTKSLPT
jgi:hypothetical protein